MNNKDAIEMGKAIIKIGLLTGEADSSVFDFTTTAINAFKKLDSIDAIIHNTQGIQEDVIRYKMICEVMNND